MEVGFAYVGEGAVLVVELPDPLVWTVGDTHLEGWMAGQQLLEGRALPPEEVATRLLWSRRRAVEAEGPDAIVGPPRAVHRQRPG